MALGNMLRRSGERREMNQATLACILTVGYPPGKPLGEAKPVRCREMGGIDLHEYCGIVESAIMSRASEYENWVELSGGWDSTIILACLRKHFSADKVKAVFYTSDLANGKCFNPFEMEKATAIAKHYGVALHTVKLSPGDPEMIELWHRVKHPPCEWMPAYWAMAETVKKNSSSKGTVFLGSFADSVHNFGFSQLMSLPYLSHDFRQYGDKMRSYLYSPSFLKKVIDESWGDDFIYRLFQWLSPHQALFLHGNLFAYLVPLMFSKTRLPCDSVNNPFLTVAGYKTFLKWLYQSYFREMVEQITPDTMYYWLLRLYQQFHLQGSERINVEGSFADSTMQVCQPYSDPRLIRFLEQMPENWGRGLEWRPTKYPLKEYGKRLKIPHEIIETQFHSYITETQQDRTANYHWELAEALYSDLKRPVGLSMFDKEWFDLDLLNEAIDTPSKYSKNPKVLLNLLAIMEANGL